VSVREPIDRYINDQSWAKSEDLRELDRRILQFRPKPNSGFWTAETVKAKWFPIQTSDMG
jgi:hypothetical protein